MPLGEIIADVVGEVIELVMERNPKIGCFLIILIIIIIGLAIWLWP